MFKDISDLINVISDLQKEIDLKEKKLEGLEQDIKSNDDKKNQIFRDISKLNMHGEEREIQNSITLISVFIAVICVFIFGNGFIFKYTIKNILLILGLTFGSLGVGAILNKVIGKFYQNKRNKNLSLVEFLESEANYLIEKNRELEELIKELKANITSIREVKLKNEEKKKELEDLLLGDVKDEVLTTIEQEEKVKNR